MQLVRHVEHLSDRLLASLLPKTDASAAACWWSFCGCYPVLPNSKIGYWRPCCRYADGHTGCGTTCTCKKIAWCSDSRYCGQI